MKIYYEDYRIKVIENELGTYDFYDSKFGGRATYKNKTKEWADDKIQRILSKRNHRKTVKL